MTPLKKGPSAESVPDMNLMLKEYYALRKFTDEGIPQKNALIKLDLKEMAELLYKGG